MAKIITKTRTVYRAPTAGRDFLTKKSAIEAEAAALIRAKYPNESGFEDYATGHSEPGFHWRELPRSDVLFRRMCRLVKSAKMEFSTTGRKA